MNKIVFTGGSGMLGSKMKELYPKARFPTSSELNVTSYNNIDRYFAYNNSVRTLVHLAAYTDTKLCETTPHGAEKAIAVNIAGTAKLATWCNRHDVHMVYMSTDFVYADGGEAKEYDPVDPINKYAWTKLGGEASVRLCNKYTIVRGSFGEDVFPYPKAYTDQYNSRLPVSEFAMRLKRVVDFGSPLGVINVGGPKKSTFEYAKELRPDVEPMELGIVQGAYSYPNDTSLSTLLYGELFEDEL